MKLHIFNPEHDMALAVNNNSITLPHVIQEFKMNLGFIPVLWADDGDCVLVDDVPFAVKAASQLRKAHADVLFVDSDALSDLPLTGIVPWGWDRCVRETLRKGGVSEKLLPDDEHLMMIKGMSSRRHTTQVLAAVRSGIESQTCGESYFAVSLEEVNRLKSKYGNIVVKAPWSSSGRGVKYVSDNEADSSKTKWIMNIIDRQGGVSVEPHYNKVKDFAMEFYSNGEGLIEYGGLSLFCTDKGRYTGNLIATEEEKLSMLSRYVTVELLQTVRERLSLLLSPMFKGIYRGCFGIDMMIVSDAGEGRFLINPCVEINLRMTMGGVANSISKTDLEPVEIMRIVHDVNYTLKFETVGNNFVNVI